ncbi:MAG: hypothetical protein M3Q58_16815 [Bacteroidota bacterium]|nr:hypothetical protein [Bacteroidota bacterium]
MVRFLENIYCKYNIYSWIPILFFVLLFGLVLAAALWSAQTAKRKLDAQGVEESEESKSETGLIIFSL